MLLVRYLNIIFLLYLIIFYYILELYIIEINSDFYFSKQLENFDIKYLLFFSIVLNILLHVANKEILILPFNLLWGKLGIKFFISIKDSITTMPFIFKYIRNSKEKIAKLDTLEKEYNYKLDKIQREEIIKNSLNFDDLSDSFFIIYKNYTEVNNSISFKLKQQISNVVTYWNSNVGTVGNIIAVTFVCIIIVGGAYMLTGRSTLDVKDILNKQNTINKENNKINSDIIDIIKKENIIISSEKDSISNILEIQKLNEEQISALALEIQNNKLQTENITSQLLDTSEKINKINNETLVLSEVVEVLRKGVEAILKGCEEEINEFDNIFSQIQRNEDSKFIPFSGKGKSLKDDN